MRAPRAPMITAAAQHAQDQDIVIVNAVRTHVVPDHETAPAFFPKCQRLVYSLFLVLNRPLSMARFTSARWSGVRLTFYGHGRCSGPACQHIKPGMSAAMQQPAVSAYHALRAVGVRAICPTLRLETTTAFQSSGVVGTVSNRSRDTDWVLARHRSSLDGHQDAVSEWRTIRSRQSLAN